MSINPLLLLRTPSRKTAIRAGVLFGVISGCYFGYSHGVHNVTDLAVVVLVALARGSLFGGVLALRAKWETPAQAAIDAPSGDDVAAPKVC